MFRLRNSSVCGLSGCGCVVVVLIINVFWGGIATQYVVEFWAGYIKNRPVDVPFLPCALAGVILGEITIPAAVATWLLSFVL